MSKYRARRYDLINSIVGFWDLSQVLRSNPNKSTFGGIEIGRSGIESILQLESSPVNARSNWITG